MTKLEVDEDPKTVKEYLANIDKRLERITRYLAVAVAVLGGILALLFLR